MKVQCMNLVVVGIFVGALFGCGSATRLEKNPSANTKDYSELYVANIVKDSRNVMPRAVKEFESMGYKVNTFDASKGLGGAQGTGFVVTRFGHVLTCAHVLLEEKQSTLWVAGNRYEADVIAVDKDKDIALLKIRSPLPEAVTPLSFRREQGYTLGGDVSTIGYPLGGVLGSNVRFTKGSLSATSGIKDDPNQLQVSAQVQPGNSGGPLFDKDGIVIGMIQATLDPKATAQATGGALPQNVNFAVKSPVLLDFLRAQSEAYDNLTFDKGDAVEQLKNSVVRVRSGIVTDAWEKTPKLVATIEYVSIWDLWYRFRYFVVRVFDYDTHEMLLAAGQNRDNLVSNEDVVIRDTFNQVRKGLSKK